MLQLDNHLQQLVVKSGNKSTIVVDLAAHNQASSLPTHQINKYDLFLASPLPHEDRGVFVEAGHVSYQVGLMTSDTSEFDRFIQQNNDYSFISTCSDPTGNTVLIAASNQPDQ